MKTAHLVLAGPLAALASAGCSSVKYDDPDKAETLTIDWGSKDLQYFADYMSDKLLESPNLTYLEAPGKDGDKRVIAAFGGIQNETREHINTDLISRRIQATLVNSGRIRFVARKEAAGQDEIEDEIRFQQGGRVNREMARSFGQQRGADVVIYGALADIYKETGRSFESGGTKRKDLYYQFYLTAVRVDTAEILWVGEEDIRKTETVGLFGRG